MILHLISKILVYSKPHGYLEILQTTLLTSNILSRNEKRCYKEQFITQEYRTYLNKYDFTNNFDYNDISLNGFVIKSVIVDHIRTSYNVINEVENIYIARHNLLKNYTIVTNLGHNNRLLNDKTFLYKYKLSYKKPIKDILYDYLYLRKHDYNFEVLKFYLETDYVPFDYINVYNIQIQKELNYPIFYDVKNKIFKINKNIKNTKILNLIEN